MRAMQLLKPKDVRVCAFWLNLLYKSLLEYNKTVKASSYINVYKRMDAGAAGHSTQLRSRVIKIYNQILYREREFSLPYIHPSVCCCLFYNFELWIDMCPRWTTKDYYILVLPSKSICNPLFWATLKDVGRGKGRRCCLRAAAQYKRYKVTAC